MAIKGANVDETRIDYHTPSLPVANPKAVSNLKPRVTTTSTFGDPLPIVYGTARVPGSLIWMRTKPSQEVGWVYAGNTTVGRYDCVTPVVAATCQTYANTTTQFKVNIANGGLSKQTIYCRTGANAGLYRIVGASPSSLQIMSVTIAWPSIPQAGDTFDIGWPVKVDTADAIIGICEAPVTSILRYWTGSNKPESVNTYLSALSSAVEVVTSGTAGTWPAVGSAYGMQADANAVGMTLSGIAQFRSSGLILDGGKVPDLSFEVKGLFLQDTTDANPADIVVDMLTHGTRGLGLAGSQVDVEYGANGLASSSYRTYCTAMGFLVSRALTSSSTYTNELDDLLDQTNSTAVWTEGVLRIVPLGDSTVGSYVPPSTATALTNDDFVASAGEDAVTVSRKPAADIRNTYRVTYQSRLDDHEEVFQEAQNTAHVSLNKIVRASVDGTWITTAGHAQKLASLKANRSVGILNTYRFRLSARLPLLDPMDLVTLTEPKLGLVSQLCRIKSIEEGEDGIFSVEAWEWPQGVGTPVIVATQPYDGYTPSASLTAVSAEQRINAIETSITDKVVPNLTNADADSVTTTLIAPLAVTEAELGSGSVTNIKIGDNAITSTKLVLTGDNLIPNPDSELGAVSGQAGAYVVGPVAVGSFYNGTYGRQLSGIANGATPSFYLDDRAVSAVAGDSFYAECMIITSGASVGGCIAAKVTKSDGSTAWQLPSYTYAPSAWTKSSLTFVCPTDTVSVIFFCQAINSSGAGGGWVNFDALMARRMIGAEIVVNGSLTADKLAADSVTAAKIAAGAVTAAKIQADAIATSDYTESAGVCTAGAKMLAGTTYTAWATSTSYSLGGTCASNGRLYRCTQAGTSSTDAYADFNPATSYSVNAIVNDAGSGNYYKCTIAGTNKQPLGANTPVSWVYVWTAGGPAGATPAVGYILDGSVRWVEDAQLRTSRSGMAVGAYNLKQYIEEVIAGRG
jgi:hypothetical protein